MPRRAQRSGTALDPLGIGDEDIGAAVLQRVVQLVARSTMR